VKKSKKNTEKSIGKREIRRVSVKQFSKSERLSECLSGGGQGNAITQKNLFGKPI
jgi:hypothetical protein